MTSSQIRVVASIVIAVLTVRATCKVLDMRSNAVYAALYLINTALNLLLINNSAFDGLRLFLLNVLTGVIVPVWYSRGPLKVRVTRMGLLWLCSAISEVVCTITSLLVTNASVRTGDIGALGPMDMFLIYLVGIPVMALCYELVITICRRHDRSYETSLDANLGPILILFSMGTYLLFAIALFRMRLKTLGQGAGPVIFFFMVCIITSVLLISLVFSVASRDAQLARERADRAASIRQIRHSKAEVTSSMERVLGVRHLRHDLSNQIDVVGELAREGNGPEADHYLALLQAQAQRLMEG